MDFGRVEFEDPEIHSGKKEEKINFQLILFNQIDVIRNERTNIISNKGNIDEAQYVNSVQTLKLLLSTYIDEEYIQNMKEFKLIEKHPVKKRIQLYDKMFEELLFVCKRGKLIGGDLVMR